MNIKFIAQGWGKDKWTDGEYQVVLKEVSLPMVERQECLSSLKKTRLGRLVNKVNKEEVNFSMKSCFTLH